MAGLEPCDGAALLNAWRESPVNGIGMLVSFYGVLVLTLAAIIIVFGMARRLGPRLARTLVGLSSLALLAFAVDQLALAVRAL